MDDDRDDHRDRDRDRDRVWSNIPIPDPSVATNERLAMGLATLRTEVKHWVDALQLLHQEKIKSAEDKTANLDRVVQTRLAGSETALNAAMAAADKVTQKQAAKVGMSKQIEGVSGKIDDMKERITRIEGMDLGSVKHRDAVRGESSIAHGERQNLIAMIALIVAALGLFAAVGAFLYTATRSAPLAPSVVYAQPPGPAAPVIPRRESLPDLPERLRMGRPTLNPAVDRTPITPLR